MKLMKIFYLLIDAHVWNMVSLQNGVCEFSYFFLNEKSFPSISFMHLWVSQYLTHFDNINI